MRQVAATVVNAGEDHPRKVRRHVEAHAVLGIEISEGLDAAGVVDEGLLPDLPAAAAPRGEEDRFAVGRPDRCHVVRGVGGQVSRRPAVRRHDLEIGLAVAPGDIGDLGFEALRRESHEEAGGSSGRHVEPGTRGLLTATLFDREPV